MSSTIAIDRQDGADADLNEGAQHEHAKNSILDGGAVRSVWRRTWRRRSSRESREPTCSGTISASPGREAVQVRVDLAPGVAFGKHTHPGEEIIYVLEGSLEYQIEGKPPVTLKAGDVLFIPAGTVHSARNVGSVTGSELATYIVEKGKPLLTLVK